MGKGRTTITQNFKVSIDINDFCEVLKEKLLEAVSLSEDHIKNVSIDDWETDGSCIDFLGSYDTGADTWYYRATMEEPEESGYEPDASLFPKAIEKELKKLLLEWLDEKTVVNSEGTGCTYKKYNPLANLITVIDVDDSSEEPIFPDVYDDGPDPDRAYDEWRDRMLEEEAYGKRV